MSGTLPAFQQQFGDFKRSILFTTLPFGSSPDLLTLVPLILEILNPAAHQHHHGVFENTKTHLRDSVLISDSSVQLMRSSCQTYYSFSGHPSVCPRQKVTLNSEESTINCSVESFVRKSIIYMINYLYSFRTDQRFLFLFPCSQLPVSPLNCFILNSPRDVAESSAVLLNMG